MTPAGQPYSRAGPTHRSRGTTQLGGVGGQWTGDLKVG